MAKGKRTYIGYYSVKTGEMVHMTNVQKKNLEAGKKGPDLSRYNKTLKLHESTKDGTLRIKEIKKG